jgi:3-oxoacyl-(acyl-carrier-protein) synthase
MLGFSVSSQYPVSCFNSASTTVIYAIIAAASVINFSSAVIMFVHSTGSLITGWADRAYVVIIGHQVFKQTVGKGQVE